MHCKKLATIKIDTTPKWKMSSSQYPPTEVIDIGFIAESNQLNKLIPVSVWISETVN